ncbi:MAG: DNA polymerase/3'-5' exonuclease PolX [Nitrospirae bacterium]|nr:DNA polymerase/3'-5' exonuclease PolX [Nitrospirota bacterium]
MKNIDISNVFTNIADLLEIKGDNPFRIRAYRKAALNIEALGRDLSSLSEEELLTLPGIGKDLAAKIEEYLKTGRIGAYENLKAELPESLLALLGIPGLGPKTVARLYKEYQVKDVDTLERLAAAHKLLKVPGIKEKTETAIIKGIEMLRRASSRHPIGRILPMADEIVKYLSENAPVERLIIAGSIRRWKDTIQDIDILSTSRRPEAVMKTFTHMPVCREVLMKGPTKASIVTDNGIQVDLRVVEEDSFGSALAYFTGSKAHNIKLRELASKAGMKINEYGIFREKDGKKLGGRTEKDIYRLLGLQYIPPELREDTGEIDAAAAGLLPRLLDEKDIRGDLHVHSSWSDGSLDIEEVIKRPMEKGYAYIALTDHSKGLGVARGLDEERILQQNRLIRALNRKLTGFRVLSGVEINIRSDGSLDISDEVLRELDIVIASVHSGFRQSREQLTGRIKAAMKNPYVSVIGHPTGRLIGEREAYDLDMEQVLGAAAETGTAVEINAYPLRLDLADSYVRIAKAGRVPIVISTDSHINSQFDNMRFGVSVARRGWLEKKDVLNTLSCNRLFKRLRKKSS